MLPPPCVTGLTLCFWWYSVLFCGRCFCAIWKCEWKVFWQLPINLILRIRPGSGKNHIIKRKHLISGGTRRRFVQWRNPFKHGHRFCEFLRRIRLPEGGCIPSSAVWVLASHKLQLSSFLLNAAAQLHASLNSQRNNHRMQMKSCVTGFGKTISFHF